MYPAFFGREGHLSPEGLAECFRFAFGQEFTTEIECACGHLFFPCEAGKGRGQILINSCGYQINLKGLSIDIQKTAQVYITHGGLLDANSDRFRFK